MSRFLAPIHSLLFNKIKVTEDLEINLVNSYREVYGEEINTIVTNINKEYGEPLEDAPLEDLIDSDNIHGWLQNKIAAAETRQAKLLGDIIKNQGEKAEKIALNVFNNHANKLAKQSKTIYETRTAPEIYAALNAYILEGMPCDAANNVTIKEVDVLEWKNIKCLHRAFWIIARANVDTLYSLRFSWFKTFVETINPQFTHTVKLDGSIFIHKIARN
ncbi:hypothetical protein [Clostridium psychrophilum]|uniref:hypothetical protein n=1 Tax=Clostridium psychrophilum TaxID=132926 RepID=UPI001C0D8557|nr:hypothetical protein [Clostridium psychrophilum]MBU3181857.1 hypothetical protein [Clostridium psychrophilum]